jgi:DNA invertase Pin-like site-specific DNA recombinase
MKFVCYYRVSTSAQGKSGLGLEALAAAKARGVKLGNPNLDLVRNTDTDQANAARLAKSKSFSMDVAEIIKEIYADGVTTYRSIARVLNDKGIKTQRNCDWTPA